MKEKTKSKKKRERKNQIRKSNQKKKPRVSRVLRNSSLRRKISLTKKIDWSMEHSQNILRKGPTSFSTLWVCLNKPISFSSTLALKMEI